MPTREWQWSTPVTPVSLASPLTRTVTIDGKQSPVESYKKNLISRGNYEVEDLGDRLDIYLISEE